MLKLADLAVREDFSLGRLRVSPALRLVTGPAGEVHVEPLTMQVLLVLADAKGRVVTRDRLYDECWGGVTVGDYSLNRTITMVRRIAAQAAPGAFRIESIPRTGYRLLVDDSADHCASPATFNWRRSAFAGAIAIGVTALAGFVWFMLDRRPAEPTVALAAAADAQSAELAAGIANSAVAAAATYGSSLRLVDHAGRSRPDFILRVGALRAGSDRKVGLTLVSGANRALVWSWSATQPTNEGEALDRMARDMGGMALSCAAETRSPRGHQPDRETIRLYVNACSKFEPWAGARLSLLTDAFEKVTLQAPQLGGAWSKLFLSKAEAIEGYPPAETASSLKNDLERSVVHRIQVPETYIARAAVLPLNARFERLQLYEAGIRRYPRNPFLLSARSWQLRSLGRMDEAARTAAQLVALYPESSAANAEYAQCLMSSGRIDAARNVLDRATRLTPDAPNLKAARWRLEMRYGDPNVALSIARSGDWVINAATISFLEARINPSDPNIDRAVQDLRGAYLADPREPSLLAQALGAFGRTEDAIGLLLSYPYGANSGDSAEMLFRPHMRQIRRDPRFILIAQRFGLTNYWSKSGILPDFCFEPGLPYDCKRELAKIRS